MIFCLILCNNCKYEVDIVERLFLFYFYKVGVFFFLKEIIFFSVGEGRRVFMVY